MANSLIHKCFTLTKFRDVANWSVSHILGMNVGFNDKYPMVSIGDIITRSTEIIIIEDDKVYRQVTVKMNGGGAVRRKEQEDNEEQGKKGKEIGTKKQYIVHTGQFIMSKIDARNGAFGVIGSNLDGAIVTADFPVFDVDKSKILPEYLKLISSTSRFVEFAKSCSSGTTNRQRINVEMFLSQEIPLPSLAKQKLIVRAYSDKIHDAEMLEEQIVRIKQHLQEYLLTELGIEKNAFAHITQTRLVVKEPAIKYLDRKLQNKECDEYRYLKIVRFKYLNEWGVDNIGQNRNALLFSNMFPNISLGKLVDINPKTSISKLNSSDLISFIPMECISDEFGEWEDKRKCKVCSSKGYTKFKSGDLIWAKITPCMQNGKSAVLGELENGYGCGSTEFHVLRNYNKEINLNYIHLLLRFPPVLKNAKKSFTGSSGQKRVPKSYLENLSIPVPDLDTQKKIVDFFEKKKQEIKDLKKIAEKKREDALKDFKEEILKPL